VKRLNCVIALAVASMLLVGCGGGSSKTASNAANTSAGTASKATGTPANTGKVGGKLVIDNESGSTWTCQFNPFNPAVELTSFAFVYEPLQYVNILQSTKPPVPWLATSSNWSNGFKTLTFTIRKGATWNDGKPFSAADVVYTFNAMKSDKAIDVNALWKADGGPLTSVTQKGSDQVEFNFATASQPYFYFVANLTPIVAKHIYSAQDQSKLHSFPDKQPVGTGPYTVANCAPQNIKYTRNAHYWQSTPNKPVPQIQEVDYPAFLSNTSANLFLSNGQAQWGGQYIPNIDTFYVKKDPAHRHYWFAPVLNVSLFPNLENPALKQLPVRQAISMGVNKKLVSQLGESGYQQPANQSGVITPTFQSWVDTSLAQPAYNPSKAEQVLKSAGFTKGSDGIYKDKSGNKLSFTVKTISGYSDWDASLQIIKQQLKKIGIDITVQDENSGPYTTDLENGKFELAYAGSGGPAAAPGPSPYYELRGLLFSGNIGSTNFERYKSSSTDALFNQYAGATQAQQVQIMHQVQKVMLNEVPFIPMTEGVNWYQYDTSHIGGWVTEKNPYAQASPYSFPDNAVVLTHLYPTQ
jgi:peptide/nickel transport system substrate-binding protein